MILLLLKEMRIGTGIEAPPLPFYPISIMHEADYIAPLHKDNPRSSVLSHSVRFISPILEEEEKSTLINSGGLGCMISHYAMQIVQGLCKIERISNAWIIPRLLN